MTRRLFVLLLIPLLAACNALSDGPPTRQVTALPTPEETEPPAPDSSATPPVLDTRAPTESSTPAPIATRSDTISCDGAPETRIVIHERAQVTYNNESLNLRNGPSTEFDVLLMMDPGALMFVADGPVCGDVYTWYRVEYRNREGWVAEGDLNEYYIRPYLPG